VEQTHNGGFPEPLPGEPVRQVLCRHDACGAETRVRIPFALPVEAVRRVVCEGCGRAFECDGVEETAAAAPEPAPAPASGAEPAAPGAQASTSRVPAWLSDPDSRAWRYLSIPIAAAAVIAALALIQGC
jgi:hypothetical protein